MTTSTAGVKLTSAISGAKTTFISEPRVGVQVRCFISLPFESTEMLCLIFGFFAAFDLNRSLSKIKHWPPHSVSYIIWRTSKKCCLNSIGWSSGTNSDIFFNAFFAFDITLLSFCDGDSRLSRRTAHRSCLRRCLTEKAPPPRALTRSGTNVLTTEFNIIWITMWLVSQWSVWILRSGWW